MHLTSPLHRVRGLGSAKDGTTHWWWERVTSLILIPFTLWFAYFLVTVAPQGIEAVRGWFGSPFHAIGTVVLLATLFYHTALGIQVVIEDYVHAEYKKLAGVVLTRLLFLILALISIFSVIRLHFGAA